MEIAITGAGIICAIGNDKQQVLESLRKGESGIGTMKYLSSKHLELPVGEVKLSNAEMAAMLSLDADYPHSRTSLMGAIAVRQALAQAGFSPDGTHWKGLEGKKVVLISGTTVGGMDITEQYFERMKTDDSLLYLPQSNECGKSTVEIAQMSGLQAECCTISTACSSALNSIMLGCEMLRRGEADVVIAGGSEAMSKFHLNGFNTLMILDRERCRPFDDTRAGLNLGEGAAFVVLRRDSDIGAAEGRNSVAEGRNGVEEALSGGNVLAYIGGYGNRCDAFHQTATSENGEGAFLAMTDALNMAGLQASDIQYVNAHGTGTPNNDITESRALQRVFGATMPAISSTKSFTGHTTSASGSIETVICLLAMQHGFIPGNLGWKHRIEGGITPTLGSEGVQLNNVVCNSFGFGGNDSSLVLCAEKPHSFAGPSGNFGVKEKARTVVDSVEELPALKEFVSPMESRRMGKLMKAAHLSAFRALQQAGIDCPDAIITATSRGMLEISQQFLDDIVSNDEELLKPTLFMQSTHNTVSSSIAIRRHCHGYNITYSQGDKSLEWALRDARRLISTGKAGNVLVVSFDESTPYFESFARRAGETLPPEVRAESIVLERM